MKSRRLSIRDLRSIVAEIAVMRDDELVDKAAAMLLALVDYQNSPSDA
jgi:hypothetical protein